PWSQLVQLNNIQLVELSTANLWALNAQIACRSFTVPHRDEFSETAGFEFNLASRKYLFIPDIDKWQRWEQDIIDLVRSADLAFLDGTFFRDGELQNRNMSEVPHPFIEETISLFEHEAEACRSKILFIHLNHTNPLLWDKKEKKALRKMGFRLAEEGKRY
ncbi:MAG TPA: MBL fold metallo-hydrolase, partial [Saprospiraceae bacterium]|nr:MBL fold metallo-hydrolase [Saprospiraceae bacterium]